jgi:hypothetical protein
MPTDAPVRYPVDDPDRQFWKDAYKSPAPPDLELPEPTPVPEPPPPDPAKK